jgi:hypothetical protein
VSTDANKEEGSSEEGNNEEGSGEEEIRKEPRAPSHADAQISVEADKVAECAHFS